MIGIMLPSVYLHYFWF